jgi:autoinducer 2 (AI-2) kinase
LIVPNYLAIDAGTGSGRAVIFDEHGHQMAAAAQEWWHASDPRYPGSMEFDTHGNWQHLAKCCQQAITQADIDASSIAAVSATSMREAFVLHDKSTREIWACANVDARAEAEVRWLQENHPALERQLYSLSGQTYALGALPRLLWLKQHEPEILANAESLTMLSDWVLFRLSGELVSEPSNAGTTGLIQLSDRSAIRDALDTVGLPTELFPRLVVSGDIVGRVTPDAAALTGLAVGTPVVAGGGDCQVGSLGLGVVAEGACAVLGGTFWQQVVNVAPSFADPTMHLRINPHVLSTLNQAEAISFFTGAVLRWFRDAFGNGKSYTEMEFAAKSVPAGAYGILPIFSDVMRYDAWFHAAPSLLNLPLDPAKGGPAAIFRALQENAAIVAHRNLQAVFSITGTHPDHIVFAGGAAKSAHWSQILADVTGLKVLTPSVKEATALGCAAIAATGIGAFTSLIEAGRAWSSIEAEFTPDMQLHELYTGIGEQWARAYAAQRELASEGVTTAMWRAPGI